MISQLLDLYSNRVSCRCQALRQGGAGFDDGAYRIGKATAAVSVEQNRNFTGKNKTFRKSFGRHEHTSPPDGAANKNSGVTVAVLAGDRLRFGRLFSAAIQRISLPGDECGYRAFGQKNGQLPDLKIEILPLPETWGNDVGDAIPGAKYDICEGVCCAIAQKGFCGFLLSAATRLSPKAALNGVAIICCVGSPYGTQSFFMRSIIILTASGTNPEMSFPYFSISAIRVEDMARFSALR